MSPSKEAVEITPRHMGDAKKVNIRFLDRMVNEIITIPYGILEDLIRQYHPHLSDAEFAIAWRLEWKADVDGIVKLGSVKKASDLDRELNIYDFVIILNEEVWHLLSDEQKAATIDHEINHCLPVTDEFGEQKLDERGRLVWRLRKHDIEEFSAVVARHGCYRHEIEDFVKRAMEAKEHPLFAVAK